MSGVEDRVAQMEQALNEKLMAMENSERELALKEAALSEANDIAQKATTLMHHFKGQAEELQKQCAGLQHASTTASAGDGHAGAAGSATSYAGVAPAWAQGLLPPATPPRQQDASQDAQPLHPRQPVALRSFIGAQHEALVK